MTGSLRQAWIYTPTDLWELLSTFSTKDASAPPDFFPDLFESVNDYLIVPTPEPELGEILNDAAKASTRFLTLKGTDFVSEFGIVEFLEAAHEVITDYDLPGYEEFFKRLLRDFLRKYNLRYRLDDPFTLRFLLPGSFTNLYAELHRLNAANPHLATLLGDFEHCFNLYVRSSHDTDLRNCVKAAANYAEWLASVTVGMPVKGNTLGALAHRLTDWPHDKLRDSLCQLYGFCSDYPAMRHSGQPGNAKRPLGPRDATGLSVLLLAFSGYLSPLVDEQAVLSS
jgi:hypothetical protein